MRSSSSSSLLPSTSTTTTAAATEERVPATEDGEPSTSSATSTRPPPRSPDRERLHSSFRDDRHYLQQMVALDRNKRSDRIDAILELKGSIEKSATSIQSRNAQQDRRHQEIQAEDARKFQELLNQGKNPYEVARTRTVRETAEKERTQIEHRIQDKQVSILKHLEVEKVWMQRQQRVKQQQQAYEKKYQKEMGRAAEEERTRQYLLARTTGGRETMDPTGKAVRLYPSQETTIKDRSFGLGKNLVHDADQRAKIVDKVHRKRAHRDTPGATPNKMLLPRVGDSSATTATSTNNNAVDAGHSPSSIAANAAAAAAVVVTSTPGQELRELNHSIVDPDGSGAAMPPVVAGRRRSTTSVDGGSSQETTNKNKKGFGKPHRSVLEQRMLEQARERQKTNIFQKQVVWGKEFTGRAFLADPQVIWFKDFDVGVPMTRQFTLTNVSNTFNHFKLLALDEKINELFEIQFEKPGRMSAGMACRITVVFTAKEARDIDSFVPAIAQTGPFSIPLQCTCKKAVPVMETRSVVFKNVVAGEKQVLTLKLENQGALPLEFRVRRVEAATTTTASSLVLRGPEQDVDGGDDGDTGKHGPSEEEEEENADIERRQEELLMQDEAVSSVVEPSVEATSTTDPVSSEDGGSAVPVDGDDLEETGDARSLSRDPSVEGNSLSPSSSGQSLGVVASSRVPLSFEEQTILDSAQAATVYRPEGADTPIRHTAKGTVSPYSTSAVSFTFAPSTAPLEIDSQVFIIDFPEATTTHRRALWGAQLLAPIHVSVSAVASSVPIFVEQSVLDLRCCLYDRLYRSQLIVCNRGSIALKMQIRVPKALEDCVECTPNMGFVQGSGSSTGAAGQFSVQIKFRPHSGMWKRLETKGFGSAALGFLAVPIQVVVPDQVVPVYFILMARVSSAALSFSRKRLDFGTCVLGHSVAHVLEITNSSRLPQRLAFVKLPQEIRLENPVLSSADPADDGMATLLPLETKIFRVVYQPNASATTLSGKLVCKTTTNDEYAIALVGECVATPLVFSHSVLQLGATQLGQKTTHSVACTNNSDKPQLLELVVPSEAANVLRVTPTVATIAARSSIRIEVEFAPQQEIYELPPSEFAPRDDQEDNIDHRKTTAAAHSITVNTSRQELTRLASSTRNFLLQQAASGSLPSWVETRGVAAEPRSVHHTWSVLCFRHTQSNTNQPVAFQVRTTVVDAALFATPSDLVFGQVAIGQTLVRELVFTNNSVRDIQLCAKPLHALGGFRMINSVQRVIRGHGGQRVVKIEFKPTAPLLYEDELELSCPEMGVVRVALSGEGVNPSLCISPADGVIDFKDVLARNRATSELQLTNASAFPLTLSIVPLLLLEGTHKELLAVTSSGLPVFTFSPSIATIPAQATLSVKVIFFPDHQRPQHYQEQFLIQVPNESERHVLSLTGRCWENQLYVFNPQEPPKLFAAPPVEDLFDVPPSTNLSSLLAGSSSGGTTASNGNMASLFSSSLAVPGIKKAATPLTVVFDGELESTSVLETKTIYIGGTLPPSTSDDDTGSSSTSSSTATTQKTGGASVGSFEFVVEENPEKPQYAKMFTLEPMKGSVTAGQQLPIQLSYQPPLGAASTISSDGVPEPTAHPELVVSQWIQVRVSCTLKGGVLWRPLPSVSGGSSTTSAAPAATTGGKGGAGGGGANAATSGESDTRVVQLVLRAKMQT